MRAQHSVRPSRRHPVRALAGLLLVAALGLTGCTGAGGGADSSGKAAAADEKADTALDSQGSDRPARVEGEQADTAPSEAPKLPSSHVIHTAELALEVEDVPKALREARSRVEDAGGHIGQETTTRDGEDAEYTEVKLRVPVERYDSVLTELEGVGSGELVHRSTKARDVTEQVVDVESRITSQRASVTRIRELMDRAERLSDVVTLEGELSTRQADLESLLARQASLKDRTALATIDLTLSQPPADEDGTDDDPGFGDALAGGWDAFVGMLRWLLVALGAVLPFLAAAAVLLLVWLKVVRPRLPRRGEPTPVMTALGPIPPAGPVAEPDGRGVEDDD
ncbi:DUF4349 domain-containing protein [Streptomyces sp. NPDC088789]|uniref:DUF4349 domain-containing protein n=1 Tax=Streptomyces sp. NPDC088789 TaxID=3365899 RepID=UPI00380A5DA2